MKKLIIKTAVITLISIIGAASIVLGALMIFAPGTSAKMFDGFGMDKAAFKFYENQYEKSENIKDLAVIIDKIDEKETPTKAEDYCLEFIEHEGYSDYIEKYGAKNFGSKTKAHEFYYGKLVIARVKLAKTQDAFDDAYDFFRKFGGYTEGNPYRTIVYEMGDSLTESDLTKLKTQIRIRKNTSNETLINQDVEEINKIIEEKKLLSEEGE